MKSCLYFYWRPTCSAENNVGKNIDRRRLYYCAGRIFVFLLRLRVLSLAGYISASRRRCLDFSRPKIKETNGRLK